MVWKQSTTFKDIVELYLKHVKSTYGEATIVFVGYGGHPSTKDHEHVRRSLKNAACQNVKVENSSKCKFNQHTFFTNDANKMGLINLMTPRLRADGVIVKQAVDDADTMIVSAALDFARSGQSVTLFANDTDVIVMLCYTFGRMKWQTFGSVLNLQGMVVNT